MRRVAPIKQQPRRRAATAPTTCLAWCRADHEADERRRLESVQVTARQLAAEGLLVEPVLDTFRVHRVEVGQVSVRAGAAEEPAALRVELQQLEDVDRTAGGSTPPRLVLWEPAGWTEDYSLDEAETLAALLQQARRLVTRAAQ